MAATAVAILQPLLDAFGRGWYFTTLALWSGVLGALAIWTIKEKGMHWRVKSIAKNKVSDNPESRAPESRPQDSTKIGVDENEISSSYGRQLSEKVEVRTKFAHLVEHKWWGRDGYKSLDQSVKENLEGLQMVQ
jgi:hypothetical protein